MLTYSEAKQAVLKAGKGTAEIERFVNKNCAHLTPRQRYLLVELGCGRDAEEDSDKADLVEDAVRKENALKKAEDEKAQKVKAEKAAREAKGLATNTVSQ
jgi:hypothetical protein